jgi:hypothetical protein
MNAEPLSIRNTLGLGKSEVKVKDTPSPIQSTPRYVKLEQDNKDLLEMRKNLKKQCENIRKSEHLRCKIYKGVKQGVDIEALLIDAIECISLMTGDTVFYTQNVRILKANAEKVKR